MKPKTFAPHRCVEAPHAVRSPHARGPFVGLSVAGILLLAAVAFSLPGCSREPAGAPLAGDASEGNTSEAGPVTVEILRDGQTRSVTLDQIAHGTTVEEVMRSIDQFPVAIRGSGTTAFVDSIDGVATGADTGWTYQVDGEPAHEGVGAKRLAPPATISWSFGGWDDAAED